MANIDFNNIDRDALNLTRAIAMAESGNGGTPNYNATGDVGTSRGAYQFNGNNFQTWAKEAGLNPDDFSAENQDKVAYYKVKSMKDDGLQPWEIASKWNSGSPNNWQNHSGTTTINGEQVAYDTPAYVSRVKSFYQQISGGGQQQTPVGDENTQIPEQQTPQAPINQGTDFSAEANQQGPKSGFLKTAESIVPFGKIAEWLGNKLAAGANKKDIDESMNMLLKTQMDLVGKIQSMKDEGQDTTRLEQALSNTQKTIQSLTENKDAIINGDVTGKQLVGSAISGIGMLALPELKGASLLTKAIAGAVGGYAIDVGTNIENNKGPVTGKDFTPGLATAIGGTLPFAGALIGKLTKIVGGFTAGTGEEVIQRAIDNPDAVGQAVKEFANNPAKKAELIQTADDALTGFKQQMTNEYGKTLESLASDSAKTTTASELAEQEFKNSMKGFGVTLKEVAPEVEEGVIQTEAPKLKFEPDFTNSHLDAEGQDAVEAAWNKIQNWSDNSAGGFDQLRRYLKDSGSPFLQNVAKGFKTGAEEIFPGYNKMVEDYAQKTSTLNTLKREISSVSGNVSDQTKLNKIMRIFRKDPLIRQKLEEAMGKEAADEFLNQISGAILSSWVPAGATGKFIRGAAEVAGLGGGVLHGIPGATAGAATTAAVGTAATSPRIVGKVARIVGGETGNVASGLNIAKIMSQRGGAQLNNQLTPGSQTTQ